MYGANTPMLCCHMAVLLSLLFCLSGGLLITVILLIWKCRDCRQLRKKAARMRQRNDEMNYFVYGAAHDLKAPLRAIMQISDRLACDLALRLDKDQNEALCLLNARAGRMSRLIDDLLAYWQADQLKCYEHNFKLTAYELIEDIRALLDVDEECIAPDPGLRKVTVMQNPMRQIMLNLIGNAVKHSHRQNLKIRIWADDSGENYRFFVSDNGPGIPDQYKEKVFKPFETLRSRDDVEGSGLGLSLVKRIAERQKGRVYVTDTPEGGATFVLIWPKNQAY